MAMTREEYKATRIKAGMTQMDLASILGVTLSTISKREMGMHKVTDESEMALRWIISNQRRATKPA